MTFYSIKKTQKILIIFLSVLTFIVAYLMNHFRKKVDILQNLEAKSSQAKIIGDGLESRVCPVSAHKRTNSNKQKAYTFGCVSFPFALCTSNPLESTTSLKTKFLHGETHAIVKDNLNTYNATQSCVDSNKQRHNASLNVRQPVENDQQIISSNIFGVYPKNNQANIENTGKEIKDSNTKSIYSNNINDVIEQKDPANINDGVKPINTLNNKKSDNSEKINLHHKENHTDQTTNSYNNTILTNMKDQVMNKSIENTKKKSLQDQNCVLKIGSDAKKVNVEIIQEINFKKKIEMRNHKTFEEESHGFCSGSNESSQAVTGIPSPAAQKEDLKNILANTHDSIMKSNAQNSNSKIVLNQENEKEKKINNVKKIKVKDIPSVISNLTTISKSNSFELKKRFLHGQNFDFDFLTTKKDNKKISICDKKKTDLYGDRVKTHLNPLIMDTNKNILPKDCDDIEMRNNEYSCRNNEFSPNFQPQNLLRISENSKNDIVNATLKHEINENLSLTIKGDKKTAQTSQKQTTLTNSSDSFHITNSNLADKEKPLQAITEGVSSNRCEVSKNLLFIDESINNQTQNTMNNLQGESSMACNGFFNVKRDLSTDREILNNTKTNKKASMIYQENEYSNSKANDDTAYANQFTDGGGVKKIGRNRSDINSYDLVDNMIKTNLCSETLKKDDNLLDLNGKIKDNYFLNSNELNNLQNISKSNEQAQTEPSIIKNKSRLFDEILKTNFTKTLIRNREMGLLCSKDEANKHIIVDNKANQWVKNTKHNCNLTPNQKKGEDREDTSVRDIQFDENISDTSLNLLKKLKNLETVQDGDVIQPKKNLKTNLQRSLKKLTKNYTVQDKPSKKPDNIAQLLKVLDDEEDNEEIKNYKKYYEPLVASNMTNAFVCECKGNKVFKDHKKTTTIHLLEFYKNMGIPGKDFINIRISLGYYAEIEVVIHSKYKPDILKNILKNIIAVNTCRYYNQFLVHIKHVIYNINNFCTYRYKFMEGYDRKLIIYAHEYNNFECYNDFKLNTWHSCSYFSLHTDVYIDLIVRNFPSLEQIAEYKKINNYQYIYLLKNNLIKQ